MILNLRSAFKLTHVYKLKTTAESTITGLGN